MSLCAISSRIFMSRVFINNLTKASSRILTFKSFQALSKVVAVKYVEVKPSFANSFCSNTTEEVALDDNETNPEADNPFQAEYTEDEIKAIFESGAARQVMKKGEPARSVPIETSIRYMDSEAFRETYGNDPVWKQYRRNHKGQIPPTKTRATCIRQNKVATANPCPICRDEFLVIHYKNVKLLKNFISEHSGEIFTYTKTGVCMKKHKDLEAAIFKAKNYGLIKYDIPFRKYNYKDYYPELKKSIS